MLGRVRYRAGQTLDLETLLEEQAQRVAARRRHHCAVHGWGIVHGLRLQTDTAAALWLRAGLAADGYGRMLYVPRDVSVQAPGPTAPASGGGATQGRYDLWLCYERSTDGPDRSREGCVLRLTTASEARVDPHRPPGVSTVDVTAVAPETTDDAAAPWPVYLGRAAHDATQRWRITPVARRYVSVCTGRVMGPGAQLALGPDCEGDALRLKPAGSESGLRLRAGGAQLAGKLAVGSAGLAPGPQGVSWAAPGGERVFGLALEAPPEDASQRLLIGLGDVGAGLSSPRPRLRIGVTVPGQGFRPLLSVSEEGRVIVHGELRVRGGMREAPIEPDLSDPRFVAALTQAQRAGSGERTD